MGEVWLCSLTLPGVKQMSFLHPLNILHLFLHAHIPHQVTNVVGVRSTLVGPPCILPSRSGNHLHVGPSHHTHTHTLSPHSTELLLSSLLSFIPKPAAAVLCLS